MYLLELTYIKPIEEVNKLLPKHNAYLDKNYANNNFIFSGRKEPRDGGIILVKANSKDELDKIYHEDPFYINKVANYKIIKFIPTKYSTEFKKIIDNK